MIDLQGTLDALDLKGHFALSKKVGGKLVSGTFSSAANGERWIGDGDTDCYITGNSVREGTTGKAQDSDIAEIKVLLVDCDPKKDSEHDPTGTTQKRMDAAWEVASAVWEHFEQKGVLVASGRGAQVWLRVEFGIDRRALLCWIREEFKHELVDIDATHDYSRLMRLPNTVNTRTGEVVSVIDEGVASPVSAADVRDLLVAWAPPASFDVPEVDRSEPTAREVRRYVTGDALRLWRDDPMEITEDRSRRDYVFLRTVIERGAPLAVASRLLHALPGSKAADRRDDGYWISTVGAALTALADDRQSADVVANVVARVEADEDYLMQPETIKALARVYVEDFEKWIQLRAKLKPLARAQGLGIGDLDKAIKKRAAAAKVVEEGPPDGSLIFTRAQDGGKGAWKVKDANGRWTWVTMWEAKVIAEHAGLDPVAATSLAMFHPFSVGLAPFKPRILPGRVWNESNARFVVQPVEGPHPTWDQLYRVVGRGLDNDLRGNKWARANGVTTGEAYLKLWAASMLQAPASRRAYLFLFSDEQGTGKSSWLESFSLLIGKACVKANRALTAERFNNELANAVFCFTEEIDLGHNGRSKLYDKVKDYTLGRTISLEAKGGQAYEVRNVTSWAQAANDQSYCPVYDGDDRITIFQCFPAEEGEVMAKDEMNERLKAEAPAFLHFLMNLEVPDAAGRYVVPPVDTEVKAIQARANRDDLKDWLAMRPDWILLGLDEVIDAFRAYLESRGLPLRFWSPQRIRRELPFTGARTRDLWQRLRGEFVDKMTSTEIKEQFGLTDPARRIGVSLTAISRVEPRVTRRVSMGRAVYSITPSKRCAEKAPS